MKQIKMHSSLSSKIDETRILSVNKIVSNYILENGINDELILISPYSEKTTRDAIIGFKNLNIDFKNVIINQLYGSHQYYSFGLQLINFCKAKNIIHKQLFVNCTNIPIIDCLKNLNILSSNIIVANYINSL